MFNRRGRLHGGLKYSRDFFERFVGDLQRAEFKQITILLPHSHVPLEEAEISVEELLQRERNYPALILVAKAPDRRETLKVLFVNRNSKAVFKDDTFPNAESEPPQLFVQSPDPARSYSLFEFFREYLHSPSMGGFIGVTLAGVLSFLYLIVVAVLLVDRGWTVVASLPPLWRAGHGLALVTALTVLFRFFSLPRGLWIKPRRELRLLYLANMALRGELKDNPLVSLVVTVLGTVIAVLVLRLLGI